jgi:hypothetical protein
MLQVLFTTFLAMLNPSAAQHQVSNQSSSCFLPVRDYKRCRRKAVETEIWHKPCEMWRVQTQQLKTLCALVGAYHRLQGASCVSHQDVKHPVGRLIVKIAFSRYKVLCRSGRMSWTRLISSVLWSQKSGWPHASSISTLEHLACTFALVRNTAPDRKSWRGCSFSSHRTWNQLLCSRPFFIPRTKTETERERMTHVDTLWSGETELFINNRRNVFTARYELNL